MAKTVVLLHEEHFCDVCWLAPKNIEKCRFESTKTCPRPRQFESSVTQNSKKRTNMSQKSSRSVPEAAKSEKKAPKSQHSANMVPKCGIWTSTLEASGPPLGVSKQEFPKASMLWGLTRLALQAARRIWRGSEEGCGRPKSSIFAVFH